MTTVPYKTRAFLKKYNRYMTLFRYYHRNPVCNNNDIKIFNPIFIDDNNCTEYIFVQLNNELQLWTSNRDHLITVSFDEFCDNSVNETDIYDYLFCKYIDEIW